MPVSADDHDKALKQVKTVLGRRHGFDPADESAVWGWDTVEAAQHGGDHLRFHGSCS